MTISAPSPATPTRPGAIESLPGPKRAPVVGNLLQLDLPLLHLQLEEWAAQFGPLFRLKLLSRDVLVISDPAAISAVLRARPDTWRRPRNFEPIFRESGGHGLFSAEGDDWRRQRRMVMTAFDPAHLRSFMPSLVRVTERLRDRWGRAARAGIDMDLQTELMCFSVDAASNLSFGVDINTIEDERSELHEHLASVFPMLMRRINMPFPYWRYIRLPFDRTYDRHKVEIHRTIEGLVSKARDRLAQRSQEGEGPTDLLEAMLLGRDADGSALTEDEVTGNVFTMLSASQDTTANSLAWAIYLLRTHPAAWNRLVDEADTILHDVTVPQDLEQARSLSYAEACANEAMRLRPVAPVLFLDAVHDTQVGHVAVPKDTTVFCVMRPAAVDEANVEHASEFRPERWLGGEGAMSTQSPKRVSMPFGAGPRLCPGRYLAMLEMSLVLGMLARNFELLEVAAPGRAAPEEALAFTMHPVGLRMRLAAR